MKLVKIKYWAAFAVVALATGFTLEANAQQTWNQGYSPSCSERSDCQHGNESWKLNSYDQSYGYGIASTRNPYRDTYRTPYQSSLGDYSGGCGDGGICGQSQAGSCPYVHRQFEQPSFGPRSADGNLRPYGGDYQSNPGFNTRPSYSSPSQRSFDNYQQAPADQRPELRTSPSFLPGDSYGRSESRPQSREPTVPPTLTQIMPAPNFPPQPSAAKPRQSSPQLLPPTSFPGSQQSAHDHAGHDHSGHDHSGHNH